MVERRKFTDKKQISDSNVVVLPPQPKRPKGFQPGNKLAKGGYGHPPYRSQKGRFLTRALEDKLEAFCEDQDPAERGKAIRYADAIVRNLVRAAAWDSDPYVRIAAAKVIFERIEGKPQQKVEVSGGKTPIQVIGRAMSPVEAMRSLQQMLDDDDE